jgi:hypothetical protein
MQYVPPYGATDPNASYVEGNPATGTRGSYPTATGYEAMMREVCNAITMGGLTPNPNDLTQLFQVINQNRRIYLATPLSIYVDATAGLDTNPGTQTQPFLTLQAAMNYVVGKINLNGQNISIICNGAFTAGVRNDRPTQGDGNVTFVFTPGSSVSVTNNSCFAAYGAGAGFAITTNPGTQAVLSASGASATNSNWGIAVLASDFAEITVSNVNFGACGVAHMQGNSQGKVLFSTALTFSGGAQYGMQGYNQGIVQIYGTTAILMNGTPAFGIAFAAATDLGQILVPSSLCSFTGSATGKRYLQTDYSVIDTAGGGASMFPGNVAGTAVGSNGYV